MSYGTQKPMGKLPLASFAENSLTEYPIRHAAMSTTKTSAHGERDRTPYKPSPGATEPCEQQYAEYPTEDPSRSIKCSDRTA